MLKIVENQHQELAQLIQRHTGKDGVFSCAIPSLFLIRQSLTTEPLHRVFNPAFCLIAQGQKEVWLAKEGFPYGPKNYLVTSVNLPVTGQVTQASKEEPYLAIKLELDPAQIVEVIQEMEMAPVSKENANRGLFIGKLNLTLLDAVLRLVRLLDQPQDIPVLAPLFTKEILYRLLQGEHGKKLQQLALAGSSTAEIGEVIQEILARFAEPFRVEDLAERTHMSVSTFHRHFKEVTAMSPLQFQKQLRLQEARRLLMVESRDATRVAYEVGYESSSQFSREYARMFGRPPIEDTKHHRQEKQNV